MKIDRTHRLGPEQYYQAPHAKRHIYLHHTVSGSWTSVWDWWNADKDPVTGGERRVGTAFVVDKDGMIYEIFNPRHWAHHLGCRTPGNLAANQESIGIEIVSEGQLTQVKGQWFWFDGKMRYRSTTESIVDLGHLWRGTQYFDAYDEPQIDALCQLVPALCQEYDITPQLLLPAGERNDYRPDLLTSQAKGVLTHCNVREDKTDVHPEFPWARLQEALAG